MFLRTSQIFLHRETFSSQRRHAASKHSHTYLGNAKSFKINHMPGCRRVGSLLKYNQLNLKMMNFVMWFRYHACRFYLWPADTKPVIRYLPAQEIIYHSPQNIERLQPKTFKIVWNFAKIVILAPDGGEKYIIFWVGGYFGEDFS